MTAVAAPARERPILFSGPMVRAILAGQKTQTRRVLVPQPDASLNHSRREIDRFHCVGIDNASGKLVYEAGNVAGPIYAFREGRDSVKADIMCPFGKAGDQLWVREMFSHREYDTSRIDDLEPMFWYWADGEQTGQPRWYDFTKPKPSIHMPRAASRLTLEITGVRVERLQAISDEEARAEGVEEYAKAALSQKNDDSPIDRYRYLWDSLNAQRGYGWEVNPWVWTLSFRVLS